MGKLFKNKILVAIAVVVIVVLVALGVWMLAPKTSQAPEPTDQGMQIKQLKPEDIGLNLEVRPDGKGLILTVSKLTGIQSIEYDVSYDAEVTDEGETAVVPRGVSGSPIEVKAGESEITRDLDLGTCSRNVCKFDKVVSEITVTVRVNYKDGTVGGVEEKISLE